MRRLWSKFLDLSIRTKLTMLFLIITMNIFVMDIFVCLKVNNAIYQINQVYASNVDTNELSDNLDELQQYLYTYLGTRSYNTLENYYKSEDKFYDSVSELNQKVTDNEVLNLERNIHYMSANYLKLTEKTIQEKRGGNIQKYKKLYEDTAELKQYISDSIHELNNLHFKQNSLQYTLLLKELKRIELISFAVIVCSAFISLFLVYMLTGNLIAPLVRLAESADRAADGDFYVEIEAPNGRDEIYTVTEAFNSMMISIRNYIQQIRMNMEKEKQMQERELLMETHLKDAQLKYLQAQINPHFLFNSLNAGAQLAAMEDAEKTCLFIERMADFFRYNVRKMEEITTLREEIQAVDNYIYIMNVRYDGEIRYQKHIRKEYYHIQVPSMILQPLVENSLNYGIRDIDWSGQIVLEAVKEDTDLLIRISDNGLGMSKDRIHKVMNGKRKERAGGSDSSGIGIDNVKNRLELFYNQKDLLTIESEGIAGKGTTVTIRIPEMPEEEKNVSDIVSG